MSDSPFLGTGYTMLPIRKIVEDGLLPKVPDAALAVYVAIAAHADREAGSARPGFLRIARLAGVSKSNVMVALGWLETNKWLSVDRTGRYFNYHLLSLEHKFDQTVAIPLRQRVVFSGLWAECPPSAKRAFIAILSRSRLGGPGEFEGVVSNFDEVCEENRGELGCRHLPESRSDPNELAKLAGLPDRTWRYATKILLNLSLTEVVDESGEYLLPNTPQKISTRVLASLRDAREKDQARSASRGARISAGRRASNNFGKS